MQSRISFSRPWCTRYALNGVVLVAMLSTAGWACRSPPVSPRPQLSAMLQVISEQNYDETFTPHVGSQ